MRQRRGCRRSNRTRYQCGSATGHGLHEIRPGTGGFGGNAFQLTLFLVASLVAGQPVLPAEGKSNAWIGVSGC
jgi:hypothetical protein